MAVDAKFGRRVLAAFVAVSVVVAMMFWAALTSAKAHDVWANGGPVPEWVKRHCCGPEDVHHLIPSEVHMTPDGYVIDGYNGPPVPFAVALPSQDGDYWAFWGVQPDGTQTVIFCFFAPPGSV